MADKKVKTVRVRLKANRKFSQTTGEGEDRVTKQVDPGSIVEVTEAQARNFADMFEDPSKASATAVELTDEEHAALEKFRADKKKEAEEAQAKAKNSPAPSEAQTKPEPKPGPGQAPAADKVK